MHDGGGRTMIRVAVVAFLLSGAAHAQALPRTPEGHPDFQGVWLSAIQTPFERAPGQTSLVISADVAKQMGKDALQRLYDRGAAGDPDALNVGSTDMLKVNGEYRTSL